MRKLSLFLLGVLISFPVFAQDVKPIQLSQKILRTMGDEPQDFFDKSLEVRSNFFSYVKGIYLIPDQDIKAIRKSIDDDFVNENPDVTYLGKAKELIILNVKNANALLTFLELFERSNTDNVNFKVHKISRIYSDLRKTAGVGTLDTNLCVTIIGGISCPAASKK